LRLNMRYVRSRTVRALTNRDIRMRITGLVFARPPRVCQALFLLSGAAMPVRRDGYATSTVAATCIAMAILLAGDALAAATFA
jgi:hypothetical protein